MHFLSHSFVFWKKDDESETLKHAITKKEIGGFERVARRPAFFELCNVNTGLP